MESNKYLENINNALNKRIDTLENTVKIQDSKIASIDAKITNISINNGRLEEIVKSTKEIVDNLSKIFDIYSNKSKFDVSDFITNKLVPIFKTSGILYYFSKIINQVNQFSK